MREETDRLLLRDIVESGQEKLVRFFSEKEAQNYILATQRDPKLMMYYFESAMDYSNSVEYSERLCLVYSIQERRTGNLIGICNLSNAVEAGSSNIGWHIGSAYSRLGYATEIVCELIRIGFNVRNVKRIYGDCFEIQFKSYKCVYKGWNAIGNLSSS